MLRTTNPSATQGSPHGLEELLDISSSLIFPGMCPYIFWPRSMVPEDSRDFLNQAQTAHTLILLLKKAM